jgi:hypothetical protein
MAMTTEPSTKGLKFRMKKKLLVLAAVALALLAANAAMTRKINKMFE